MIYKRTDVYCGTQTQRIELNLLEIRVVLTAEFIQTRTVEIHLNRIKSSRNESLSRRYT